MNKNTATFSAVALQDGVQVSGPLQKLGEVKAPGFYYAPTNLVEHERMAHFNGKDWRFVGDDGTFSVRTLMGNLEVYGPLHFDKCMVEPGDCWPEEGDEFDVFVDVRDDGRGGVDGFVLNPPLPLANMLGHYGPDMCMVEEYFGQDFLPNTPGTYRMKLRMYVDPACQLDDNEWTDAEPGLEVLSIEQASFAPVKRETSV